MNTPRLLFLTDDFLPHQGGSRVYYHELLSRLEGVDCRVLTRRQEGDAAFDERQVYQVERVDLGAWNFLKRLRMQFLPLYLRLLWRTFRIMRQFKPTVLVAGELVPTGPVASLCAWWFRVPLVVFTHAEGPPTIGRTRFQSRLARWACRQALVVVAASDNARDGLTRWLGVPAEKIEVLLPGVGEEHFDERFRARPCQKAGGAITLLSVGRLVARKGHRTVLEALPELVKDFPGLRYVIIGTGPLEMELQTLARDLGMDKRVRFAGKMDALGLMEAYAAADCFVLPNMDNPETGDTEGFGIVFGEAAAHGLPVVGGKAGGTAHSIRDGETGFRVDGSNPEAVADAVRRIVQDGANARVYGEAGRQMALREFRWAGRTKRFKEIVFPHL